MGLSTFKVAVMAVLVVLASLHAMCKQVAAESLTETSINTGNATAASSPYDLDSIPDLQTLLWRHQQYQGSALSGSGPVTTPAVLVESDMGMGLGNRLPAIVTGYVLALFTQRLFLLQSPIQDFMDLPFPGNWQTLKGRFEGASQCKVVWKQLADGNMALCAQREPEKLGRRPADIWCYSSIDYELPVMQINPALSKYFDKSFPDGEVYHSVIQHLLRPNSMLQQELQRYQQDSQPCAIGMHIRTRKHGRVHVRQFTNIARMLARGVQGSVFVASDASLFEHVQQALPDRHVWWSNHTATSLQAAATTQGNNPGTELSAVLDMMLLSRCANIILTPASTLGGVAAALGGVRPVFAIFGKHTDPFTNPYFLQSVTSEPCFCKANAMHLSTRELAVRYGGQELPTRFREQHPLFLYYNQCHYRDELREVPQHSQLRTDTSYIQSLIRR